MSRSALRRTVEIATAGSLLLVAPVLAQHTAKQTPPIQFGTSGGSAKDISTSFCCAGTLGSLVLRDGTRYILSNNHVLARSGSAVVGESTIQPGLVDSNCSATNDNVVGTFEGNFVPLGHNTDTAVSQAITSQVNTSGAILGIGVPCSSTVTPTVGMSVTKSGRTTGVTTGTIQAVNVSATVAYETMCNAGRSFNESYTNQVAITPGTFSAGGDSGSLILNSTHHPVALLFAGSSSETIANPIQSVVSAYQAGGHTFSFVGTACSSLKEDMQLTGPAAMDVEFARSIKEQHETEVLALPGVLGIGVGKVDDDDATTETAIIVFIDSARGALPRNLPTDLDGVKVRLIPTDRFVAR
jgi:hypothetical protein